MTWTGPDSPYQPPGRPGGPTGPAPYHAAGPYPGAPYPGLPPPVSPARSVRWRIGHSLWILVAVVGFGCLSGVGLLYVGVRARRPAWWIAGIGYTVLSFGCFALIGESSTESVASTIGTLALLLLWFGSIVHSCVINPAWLRWRSGYVPWYSQQPVWAGPQGYPAASAPLPPQLQGVAPPPEEFYARPDAGRPPAPKPADQPAAAAPVTAPEPPAGTAPAEPLDVNTATAQEIATLPGFDADRAARVVAERNARHGFASVADFAGAAGLAPHELIAVRDRVTFAPAGMATPDQAPPYGGRILDV